MENSIGPQGPEMNVETNREARSATVQTPILVDHTTQSLVAHDNAQLVRMIRIFMNGAALPKSLDTEAKVITAWQAAASLKVPPIVAIQNMAIIHGSLAIWGQLPKALALATNQMEECKLILFDPDQKVISLENKNLTSVVWGATIQMRRLRQSMNEYFFTEIEAAKAGLLKKTGPWQDYRKVMYSRRAMGQAVKFEFPDAVMGLNIAEYDFHTAPDLENMKTVISQDGLIAKQMNAFAEETNSAKEEGVVEC